MSKIDDLIAKYCPNGVEYSKLGEVLSRSKGTKITAAQMKDLHNTNGDIKVFAGGKTFAMIMSDNIPSKDINYNPSIIVKSRGVIEFEFYDKPFTHKNEFWSYYSENENILIKYVYYYLKLNEAYFQQLASKMQMPQISLPDTQKYKIPIPPLPVQEEIVNILDKFTALEAELEAELEARTRQYKYYRNQLLSFEGKEVKWKTLGELYDFKNGLNKGKEFFGKGTPIVNFTDVFKNRSLTKEKLKGKVELNNIEIQRYSAKANDLFFTRTSEVRDEIGMASVLLDEIDNCIFSGFVLRARPKTSLHIPKFISYYLTIPIVRNEIIRHSSFTTRGLTSGPKLSKIKLPLLPLDEQERIVTILDKFDALVNDISTGLPAEIQARRQQYEYYRGKLLTFESLTA